MIKKVFILFFLISFAGKAQDKSSLSYFQDTLQTICKKLYSSRNDAEKQKNNQLLLACFERALNTHESFDFGFDSLKKDIGVLLSPDKKFRIINWNVPKEDGTQEYFGFLQVKQLDKKTKIESIQLFPLTDKSYEIKSPENTITDHKKWFGALYNKIIIKKTKAKIYYSLLGWDGNDNITQKKIIEVLTFDNNGMPHFGADIFNMPKKYPKRIIFEYSASCNMSLKYNERKDSIIFDHLDATQLQLVGQYQYYCGDFTYDGFGFKKGKWNFGTKLTPYNEKDYKDKYYKDPEKPIQQKESNLLIEQPKKKQKK
jgi:hypothetical protein